MSSLRIPNELVRESTSVKISRAFSCLANRGQGVGVPELTDEEGGFRRAEIVFGGITHDEAVAVQLLADDLQRCGDSVRRWRCSRPELGNQQGAGVEVVVVERAGERPPLGAPGAL